MKPHFRTLGAGVVLLGLTSQGAHAAIQVTLDGQPLATSVAPVQINGRTLVPMRDIFEALGANLNWNAVAQTITASKGLTNIQLGINNPSAIVNGRNVVLDQPPMLLDGRTFVPLRFVSEAMNAQVDWNNALQVVSIRTPNQYAANPGLPNPAGQPYTPPAYQPPIGNPGVPAYIPPVTNPNSPNYIPPTTGGTQVGEYRAVSVPAGVVVPVSFDQDISSSTARVGDRFTVSIVSRRLGDSEFPAGTKLEGTIVEARPRENNTPGVLDFEFRNAILPDGSRVPLNGSLISLDDKSVQTVNGRIEARGAQKNNNLKVIGIGAAGGFVLGELLNTNRTLTTILGAAGGYLVGRAQNRRAEEANIKAGSTIGVRLDSEVRYRDTADYDTYRTRYMRNGVNRFDPREYGFDPVVAGPTTRNDRYDGYDAYDTVPPADVYATNNPNYIPPVTTRPNVPVNARQISLPQGVVVPLTMDEEINSSTATAGQNFTATVESRQVGDSEFPAGTKIRGRVLTAQPRQGNEPGTLELEFRAAILPDGTRVPLRGSLIALDTNTVDVSDGRIMAKPGKNSNNLKVIGVGAAAGFVVGRLLKKDGILPALIGALGGYIYGQSQNDRPAEAVVPAGARLGMRLDDSLVYADTTNYTRQRNRFIRQTS